MKLSIATSVLLFAISGAAFAASAPAAITNNTPVMISAPSPFYVGIFGGVSSSNKFNVSQYGTAYYIEADGGPLAVNAFGNANSETSAFYGAQLGYHAPTIQLSPQWTLTPAAELEGFAISNNTFNASLVNDSDRLAVHAFNTSYPISENVFLANAVFNFNYPRFVVQPYVGLGIGAAVLRIAGADATQIAPPEAGVNHYNANPSDSTSTFAGQFKLGVNYDINQYFSIFGEYRYLYLASTGFVFGSTVYAAHPATSSWQVNFDAQKFNMLDVGLRVNI